MNEKKKKLYFWLGVAGVLLGLGIIFSIRNRRKIVKFSEIFIGQTEVGDNLGFTSKRFEELMKEVGWKPGDAWCVYFAKLVWYNMAPEFLKQKILKKVSGNVFTTWDNLKNDENFKISTIPQQGDMAVWRLYRNGEPQSGGHVGIVKKLGFGNFTTIEGNTDDSGLGRGYIVAEKTRNIDFTNKNGLRLMGFIRFA